MCDLGCRAFHCTLFASPTPRGVLRLYPDHSLVSASARFTVLWPGFDSSRRSGGFVDHRPSKNTVGTKWQSLKPQNPQGIKAVSVGASGGSW